MKENKQAICDALCAALQLTRAGKYIESIDYDCGLEIATVHYSDGENMPINVALDSGLAMIRDIIKRM